MIPLAFADSISQVRRFKFHARPMFLIQDLQSDIRTSMALPAPSCSSPQESKTNKRLSPRIRKRSLSRSSPKASKPCIRPFLLNQSIIASQPRTAAVFDSSPTVHKPQWHRSTGTVLQADLARSRLHVRKGRFVPVSIPGLHSSATMPLCSIPR